MFQFVNAFLILVLYSGYSGRRLDIVHEGHANQVNSGLWSMFWSYRIHCPQQGAPWAYYCFASPWCTVRMPEQVLCWLAYQQGQLGHQVSCRDWHTVCLSFHTNTHSTCTANCLSPPGRSLGFACCTFCVYYDGERFKFPLSKYNIAKLRKAYYEATGNHVFGCWRCSMVCTCAKSRFRRVRLKKKMAAAYIFISAAVCILI